MPTSKLFYPRLKKMFLLLLFFVVSCASEQPCLDYQSVDISDVPSLKNGSIVQDGVLFAPNHVYSKKVNSEMKKFGCLCQSKYCIRKCCPLGSVYVGKNCTELPQKDLLLNDGINTFYKSKLIENVDLKKKSFDLIFGKACQQVYVEFNKWYIQQGGVKGLTGRGTFKIQSFSDTSSPSSNIFHCFLSLATSLQLGLASWL